MRNAVRGPIVCLVLEVTFLFIVPKQKGRFCTISEFRFQCTVGLWPQVDPSVALVILSDCGYGSCGLPFGPSYHTSSSCLPFCPSYRWRPWTTLRNRSDEREQLLDWSPWSVQLISEAEGSNVVPDSNPKIIVCVNGVSKDWMIIASMTSITKKKGWVYVWYNAWSSLI